MNDTCYTSESDSWCVTERAVNDTCYTSESDKLPTIPSSTIGWLVSHTLTSSLASILCES